MRLTFTIYDAQTSGNTLWFEEHLNIAVVAGAFKAKLGSVNALNLAFDMPYWLGIRIANDPELSPRIALTGTAYSFFSLKADSIKESNVTTASIKDGAVTIPKLGPDVLMKVYEGSCNNVSSFLIDGLDGNLHKIYKIFFRGVIHTADSRLLLIRPNEDDVVNNYRSWLYHYGDASGANACLWGMFLGRSWDSACDLNSEITLFAEAGSWRYSHGSGMMGRVAAVQSLGMQYYSRWFNMTDNLTSIRIAITDFNGLSSGTFSGTFSIFAVYPR